MMKAQARKTEAPRHSFPRVKTGPVGYSEMLHNTGADSQACEEWIAFYEKEADPDLLAYWRRRQARYDQLIRVLGAIQGSQEIRDMIRAELMAIAERDAAAATAVQPDTHAEGDVEQGAEA
jgi:hypothetical protein